jgi:hypothetical protein
MTKLVTEQMINMNIEHFHTILYAYWTTLKAIISHTPFQLVRVSK